MKTVPSPEFTGMICRDCLFVIIYPGDLTRCSTSTLDEIVFILPVIPCTNPKKSSLSSSKIESILEFFLSIIDHFDCALCYVIKNSCTNPKKSA